MSSSDHRYVILCIYVCTEVWECMTFSYSVCMGLCIHGMVEVAYMGL